MVADVTYELTPRADSLAEARAAACEWASDLDRDLVFALELVVSELVTNAIRHGAGQITMTLAAAADGVRVGVHDHGYGLPVPRIAGIRAPGGRGLRLVDRLSSSWGVDPTASGDGKTVWAVVVAPSLGSQSAVG